VARCNVSQYTASIVYVRLQECNKQDYVQAVQTGPALTLHCSSFPEAVIAKLCVRALALLLAWSHLCSMRARTVHIRSQQNRMIILRSIQHASVSHSLMHQRQYSCTNSSSSSDARRTCKRHLLLHILSARAKLLHNWWRHQSCNTSLLMRLTVSTENMRSPTCT
jgi:hypothetical protein